MVDFIGWLICLAEGQNFLGHLKPKSVLFLKLFYGFN